MAEPTTMTADKYPPSPSSCGWILSREPWWGGSSKLSYYIHTYVTPLSSRSKSGWKYCNCIYVSIYISNFQVQAEVGNYIRRRGGICKYHYYCHMDVYISTLQVEGGVGEDIIMGGTKYTIRSPIYVIISFIMRTYIPLCRYRFMNYIYTYINAWGIDWVK